MSTLRFLNEGDSLEVQGSGKKPYLIRKIGGVVDCSCPAWRNLGGGIDTRVCKHIKATVDPNCLLPQAQAAMGFTGTGLPTVITSQYKPKEAKPEFDSPCLLAHVWEGEDPTGWFISEKYDGVRAWWDGKNFISREGNIFHAPEWFKKSMPKFTLDGELWTGRRQFQTTLSYVRKQVPNDDEWKQIHYAVFDLPEEKLPFEERMSILVEEISSDPAERVFLVEQIKCQSVIHLRDRLADIEALGGEGLMLRMAGSMYEAGKSPTCLKVKTFYDDEAKVLGYEKGKGKNKGMVGALLVSWNGHEFELGSGLADSDRRNPPAIGSKVTFRYTGLTNSGKPRCASFVAVRDYE